MRLAAVEGGGTTFVAAIAEGDPTALSDLASSWIVNRQSFPTDQKDPQVIDYDPYVPFSSWYML
jgi:hypothetical protein